MTLDEKARILQLRDELHRHNYRYYVENAPVISDQEFDFLMHELQDLEARHPEMFDPNSPTQRVGSDLNNEFETVRHSRPMLSLGNTYSVGEIEEFAARADKSLALKHPNWSMGAKIPIDSATMMNKGFEVIEAKWLFDVEPERIHVVVHPESVIHSMVEFADGAVLAQLGCPDMREPIQLAMAFPERLSLNNKKLDFSALGGLTFFEPDMDKFPCLKLAFDAIGKGGNLPCALNAANEAAVAGYLKDRIGFYDIPAIASEVLARTEFVAEPTLDDVFATNDAAYVHALHLIW